LAYPTNPTFGGNHEAYGFETENSPEGENAIEGQNRPKKEEPFKAKPYTDRQ